ncbi:MAG: metallophosphoesterase [Planctomycetes bacterium RBG_16_43_13]|nr:MAG: metallophosphoesterase [Planctomycetes bacterium RBG_16_43_13]
MKTKILAIGDIVGKPGAGIIKKHLHKFATEQHIDLVIGNAENVAGGSGITPRDADELISAGVNVITAGDHVWAKREIIPYISSSERLIRPANYPDDNPGKGYTCVEAKNGAMVGVMHIQGRVFMATPVDSPFKVAKKIADELHQKTKIVIVDMHAEATSEKIAIGWYLDGIVSFIFGTHTHIQTADERILPLGTAYITDLGMTGPYDSVIGRRTDRVLHKFVTQMPAPFDVATGDVRLCGAIATINSDTGRADEIRRVVILEDGTVKI